MTWPVNDIPEILQTPASRRILIEGIKANALRQKAQKDLPKLTNDPLSLVSSGKLQIKDKHGQRIPLVLNNCQSKVFKEILRLRAEGKPVRLWILKFRQGGISTLCEALLYALTSVLPNRGALVMADDKDKANYIHEISKSYHENMKASDPAITPDILRSNERKLEFAGLKSQMMIQTAENVDAPRARTYQYVHLSEAAFYPHLDKIMKALQGVPDHGDTVVLIETTANGAGTVAHTEWQAAKTGKTAWTAIFLPWYIHEEYEMDPPEYSIEQIQTDRTGGLEKFLEEEEQIGEEIKLELGCDYYTVARKLNWRRWCIVNKCERKVATFRVEYPTNDKEAWAVSGELYYPAEYTQNQREREPLRRGYLVPGIDRPEIRDSVDGPIDFFLWPEKDESYVIPGDPSEGLSQDEAACVVRSVKTNENCAELASKTMDADHLAAQMFLLWKLYNMNGILVPERNGNGVALVNSLRKLTGAIWHEKVTEKGGVSVEREGWHTNDVSRPLAFEQLGTDMRDGIVRLNGKRSITEVSQLINNAGKPEAPPNGQDGLAICNAIASKARAMRRPHFKTPSTTAYARSRQQPPPMNQGRGYKS